MFGLRLKGGFIWGKSGLSRKREMAGNSGSSDVAVTNFLLHRDCAGRSKMSVGFFYFVIGFVLGAVLGYRAGGNNGE